jgi:hypothetical protein
LVKCIELSAISGARFASRGSLSTSNNAVVVTIQPGYNGQMLHFSIAPPGQPVKHESSEHFTSMFLIPSKTLEAHAPLMRTLLPPLHTDAARESKMGLAWDTATRVPRTARRSNEHAQMPIVFHSRIKSSGYGSTHVDSVQRQRRSSRPETNRSASANTASKMREYPLACGLICKSQPVELSPGAWTHPIRGVEHR